MTREDIIQMAQEARLLRQQHNLMSNPVQHRFSYDGYEENFERFAALVASAEREAYAKIGDDHPSWSSRMYSATIRARGQA